MPYRFFYRCGDIRVELFEEIFARHTQSQICDGITQRARVVGDGFGRGDGVQRIVAGQYL